MRKNILLLICSLPLLSSCNCTEPLSITSIQKSDKKLACKDLILEINEAEHYRDQAVDSKNVGVGEMLTPSCWVSGYVSGNQAIKSANARINYLGHIYDLLDCGGKAKARRGAGAPQAGGQPQTRTMQAPLPPQQPYSQMPQSVPVNQIPRQAPPYPYQQPTATSGPRSAPPIPTMPTAAPQQRRRPALQMDPTNSKTTDYYRRIPIDEAVGDAWLHEHKDNKLQLYTHSHPHRGTHQHAEDKK